LDRQKHKETIINANVYSVLSEKRYKKCTKNKMDVLGKWAK
jgi:hypothetical protein